MPMTLRQRWGQWAKEAVVTSRRLALPVLRLARPARYTDADPFKLILVPAGDLRMMQRRWAGDLDLPWLERGTFGRWSSHRRRWHAGRVLDGDWDLACQPLDDYHLSLIVRDRFILGRAWEEIPYIRRALAKVNQGKRAWGSRCATPAEVKARCLYIDKLYQRLKKDGYKSGADARFTHFLVNIGRDGEIIRNNDGKHRIILSRLLDMPGLPARVLVRHPHWQAVRDAIRSGDRKIAARYRGHPDLTDLLPAVSLTPGTNHA
jgi:hypothetical protein